MKRQSPIIGLGTTLKAWLDKNRLSGELDRRGIELRWAELVGARTAGHTAPRGVYEGVLHVVVSSSAWLHELTFLKDELLTRINAQLGRRVIKDIRLFAGSIRPQKRGGLPRVTKAALVLSEPERALLARRADGEIPPVRDDQLRAVIVAARRAQLERRQILEKESPPKAT